MVTFYAEAQETTSKNYVRQWQGKTKTHTLGYYGGVYGTYSPVDNRAAQWLSGRLGVVIDRHWGIGVAGSMLNYDYKLSEVVNDGTYRLQAAFTGIFIDDGITKFGSFNNSLFFFTLIVIGMLLPQNSF